MRNWKVAGSITAVVVAGIAGMALPGNAQKKQGKADPTLGYVDLAQVTEQIKKTPDWQKSVSTFETERTKARTEIESLTKIRYLNEQERQQLLNLRAKNNPTDNEKKQVDELEAKSTKFEQEYQTLAMVEKPSPEQSKRIGELDDMRKKAQTSLQEEYEKRAETLRKMEAGVLDEMQGRILKRVQEVAEGKGIVMVVDRQAILYGGHDLTSDVLKKLGAN
jgi:Skp family chaperone for outer membrane proteins